MELLFSPLNSFPSFFLGQLEGEAGALTSPTEPSVSVDSFEILTDAEVNDAKREERYARPSITLSFYLLLCALEKWEDRKMFLLVLQVLQK